MSEKTFEDRILDAVVSQFFAPVVQQTPTWNQFTQQNEPVAFAAPSPAARVAADIFAAHKTEILTAVKDKVDLDVIARAVAVKVQGEIADKLLASGTNSYSYGNPERQAMQKMVNAAFTANGRVAP